MSAGADGYLLLVVLAGGVATYIWRALGVFAAQALDPEGNLLRWLGCVATAIVAALCVKLALAPPQVLESTHLLTRLGALFGGVAAFYVSANTTIGVGVSFALIVLVEQFFRPAF
ncbi:MAG: AzlD domain-containing protein [Pseudomonadota bacterium]